MATRKTGGYRPDMPIKDSDGRKCATLRFRTLREMESALDWSVARPENERRGSSLKTYPKSDRNPWAGTNTPEEYIDMLESRGLHSATDAPLKQDGVGPFSRLIF